MSAPAPSSRTAVPPVQTCGISIFRREIRPLTSMLARMVGKMRFQAIEAPAKATTPDVLVALRDLEIAVNRLTCTLVPAVHILAEQSISMGFAARQATGAASPDPSRQTTSADQPSEDMPF